MKAQNGCCVVDSNKYHENTFGNNVHTLFLNSFFLNDEGTMGAYAENKINTIISKLRGKEKFVDKEKRIYNTILLIGDNLIKKKLLELYNEKVGAGEQTKQRERVVEGGNAIDETIAMLKAQVQQLQVTIKELEKMKND